MQLIQTTTSTSPLYGQLYNDIPHGWPPPPSSSIYSNGGARDFASRQASLAKLVTLLATSTLVPRRACLLFLRVHLSSLLSLTWLVCRHRENNEKYARTQVQPAGRGPCVQRCPGIQVIAVLVLVLCRPRYNPSCKLLRREVLAPLGGYQTSQRRYRASYRHLFW